MSGEQYFINNTAVDGGALHLLSFAQLRLLPGLTCSFKETLVGMYSLYMIIKNYINIYSLCYRYGSSIFVDSTRKSSVFTKIQYNPQCFMLLYSNQQRPPSQWDQVKKYDTVQLFIKIN